MDKEDVVYIYTMEYYLAMKKNEILLYATTWMDLECITLSKIRYIKTNIFTYMWNLKKPTNKYNKMETDSQIQRTN